MRSVSEKCVQFSECDLHRASSGSPTEHVYLIHLVSTIKWVGYVPFIFYSTPIYASSNASPVVIKSKPSLGSQATTVGQARIARAPCYLSKTRG